MAARVTDPEVRAILPGTGDLSAHIATAHIVVEANAAGKGYSEEELKELERWLSAHMAQASPAERVASSVNPETGSVGYKSGGLDLDATAHGQRVKLLDRLGALSGPGRRKASIRAAREGWQR